MPRVAASESVVVVRFRSRSKGGSGGIADEHGLRLLGGIRLGYKGVRYRLPDLESFVSAGAVAA